MSEELKYYKCRKIIICNYWLFLWMIGCLVPTCTFRDRWAVSLPEHWSSHFIIRAITFIYLDDWLLSPSFQLHIQEYGLCWSLQTFLWKIKIYLFILNNVSSLHASLPSSSHFFSQPAFSIGLTCSSLFLHFHAVFKVHELSLTIRLHFGHKKLTLLGDFGDGFGVVLFSCWRVIGCGLALQDFKVSKSCELTVHSLWHVIFLLPLLRLITFPFQRLICFGHR
jgi:hypothetical protein